MPSMKTILYALACLMLTDMIAAGNSRERVQNSYGGAGGSSRGNTSSNASNKSTSAPNKYSSISSNTWSTSTTFTSSYNNNKATNNASNYNKSNNAASNGGITGNGTTGTLANRKTPVMCPICVGTWFESKKIAGTGNSNTCGDLQESVQDVDPTAYAEQQQWCRSNQLKAEEQGCCASITFSDKVQSINAPCAPLCNGYVPQSKVGVLVPTSMGSISCEMVSELLSTGMFSPTLCPRITAEAASCCTSVNGRSGQYLRGAASGYDP